MAKSESLKPGKYFESSVARIERALATDPKVTRIEAPARLRDKSSDTLREFDVVVTHTVGHHQITTAMECRDRSRKVGEPDVEAFVAKCADAPIDRAIIVSSKGFSSGALRKARFHKIACCTLTEGGALPARVPRIGNTVWEFKPETVVTLSALYKDKPSAIFRSDGSPYDLKGAVTSIQTHFATLPLPETDGESEVWYSLPCADLHVFDPNSVVKIPLTSLIVVVRGGWKSYPVDVNVLTYADTLAETTISTETTVKSRGGFTLTLRLSPALRCSRRCQHQQRLGSFGSPSEFCCHGKSISAPAP